MSSIIPHQAEYLEPIVTWRYFFSNGNLMDVETRACSSSHERQWVLKEAQRVWGGKLDDWAIAGAVRLPDATESEGDAS